MGSFLLGAAIHYYCMPLKIESTLGVRFFWVSLVFLYVSNLTRLVLCYNVSKSEDFDNHRTRNFFKFTVLLSGLSWGGLASTILFFIGDNSVQGQLVLLILCGVMASSLVSLLASPGLFRWFIFSVILGPVSVITIQHMNSSDVIYSMVMILYSFFLVVQQKLQFKNLLGRLMSEQNLIREKEKFESLFDSIPGAISWLDNDLNYRVVNKDLCDSIGLKKSEIVGKNVGFMDQNSNWAKLIKDFKDSGDVGIKVEVNFKNHKKSNWRMVYLQKLTSPLNGILCTAIDIQKEKELQNESQEQRLKAESSARLASLGIMAGGIAHEINNPLTVINSKASQMKRFLDDPNPDLSIVKNNLEKIEANVKRIAKIITSLRKFSRDGSNDDFSKFNISDLIKDTVEVCSERFRLHNIALTVKVESDLTAEGQFVQLGQVLLNMLNNAHDAVYETSDAWIDIKGFKEDDYVYIEITDSGKGIPEEVANKMMQPIFTTKPIGKGSGLGLSISLSIMREHKGDLILNKAHENTQFVIRFPINSNITHHKFDAA